MEFSHNGLGDLKPIELSEEQRNKVIEIIRNNPQLVFYGFAKLTPKIVRKRSIVILYENSNSWNERKQKFIKQKMEIIHVRVQTKEEILSGKNYNREFIRYDIFVDDKKYKGNLDVALETNFLAEENTVSDFERNVIREKLKSRYHDFYKISRLPQGQQSLIFY